MATWHCIRGKFMTKGYQPDGDSVRFLPFGLPNNKKNHIQLRLYGIDAPETHYLGQHQPRISAYESQFALMRYIIGEDVQMNITGTTYLSNAEGAEGWILYRNFDSYRRPICLIFAGTAFEPGQMNIREEQIPVALSANYRLLANGYAVPFLFAPETPRINSVLLQGAREALACGNGPFATEFMMECQMDFLSNITKDNLIFPRLFRRVVAFATRNDNFEKLSAHLEANRDMCLIDGKAAIGSEVFAYKDSTLKMLVEPGRILWIT